MWFYSIHADTCICSWEHNKLCFEVFYLSALEHKFTVEEVFTFQ